MLKGKEIKEFNIAFILKNKRYPKIGMVINHIDHWKENSDPNNLEEITYSENTKKAYAFYKKYPGFSWLKKKEQIECLICKAKFFPYTCSQKICSKEECKKISRKKYSKLPHVKEKVRNYGKWRRKNFPHIYRAYDIRKRYKSCTSQISFFNERKQSQA